MFKSALTLLMAGLLVSAAFAEQRTVTTVDGRTITGEVSDKDDQYWIKTQFGTIAVDKKDVKSITSPEEQRSEYEERLEKIDRDDPDQRVSLAGWAMEQGLDDAAESELKAALKLDPDHEVAQLLLRQLQMRSGTQPASRPSGDNGPGPGPASRPELDLVPDEDIQRIRHFEIDTSPEGPNIIVELRNDVVERFLTMMEGTGEFRDSDALQRFRRQSRSRQAKYILANTRPDNQDIRQDIIIKSDPQSIREFRTRVWPGIRNNCAQLSCHGAAEGKGGLKLFNIAGRSDRRDYTNFLILSLWEEDGRSIIDRAHRGDSLLLQHGLPQKIAKFKHPEDLRRTLFRDNDDPGYRRTYEWISSLKGASRPEYRTTYQPPAGKKLNASGGSSVLDLLSTSQPDEPEEPVTDDMLFED